ncbi:MAG: alanine racemase [Erythrobacter sp.]|uniref:alanine racemase n=1 Tax=Erythrobacter sp. TaxID=1042 RepID=UPI00261470D7|nr:alanine racemase [Erythrobacter sp.]MDJ0978172.1 alanine racemase [Erythrobacter sp.]
MGSRRTLEIKRREALIGIAGAAAVPLLPSDSVLAANDGALANADPRKSFDPWVEVSRTRLESNANSILSRSKGAKLMPVIKANGYGLGAATVARMYDSMPGVQGYMVVRPHEAFELAELGLRKPILLMAPASQNDSIALARAGVHLAMTLKDTPETVSEIARAVGRPISVHLEVDTGINRQGIPWRIAGERAKELAASGAVRITGTASYFVTPPGDRPQTEAWQPELEQIERFEGVLAAMRTAGIDPGVRHMVSSRSLFQYPQAYYDAVRLGILPTGSYPTAEARASGRVDIEQSFEVKCRVAQVSWVPPGDTVGFQKRHDQPNGTWVATVLSGSPGGLPSDRQVWVNGHLRPLLMTGPRLYTLVDLGPEPIAKIGDEVIMTGRADPSITAEALGNPWYLYVLADRLPSVAVA